MSDVALCLTRALQCTTVWRHAFSWTRPRMWSTMWRRYTGCSSPAACGSTSVREQVACDGSVVECHRSLSLSLISHLSCVAVSGPLLYHWSEMPGELSIELSWEELKRVIESFGFVIEVRARGVGDGPPPFSFLHTRQTSNRRKKGDCARTMTTPGPCCTRSTTAFCSPPPNRSTTIKRRPPARPRHLPTWFGTARVCGACRVAFEEMKFGRRLFISHARRSVGKLDFYQSHRRN
jgi:hypothetical protein